MKSLSLATKVLPLALLLSVPHSLLSRRGASFDDDAGMVAGSRSTQSPKHVKTVKSKGDLYDALKQASADDKHFALKMSADWCGACTMSKVPFAEAIEKHKEKVFGIELDADSPDLKEFIRYFDIQGLPTFVYVRREVVPAGAGEAPGTGRPLRKVGTRKELIDALRSGKHMAFKVGSGGTTRLPYIQNVSRKWGNVGLFELDTESAEIKDFLKALGSENLNGALYIRKEVGSRTGPQFEEIIADLAAPAQAAQQAPARLAERVSAEPAPAARARVVEREFIEERPSRRRSRRPIFVESREEVTVDSNRQEQQRPRRGRGRRSAQENLSDVGFPTRDRGFYTE